MAKPNRIGTKDRQELERLIRSFPEETHCLLAKLGMENPFDDFEAKRSTESATRNGSRRGASRRS
jgi:hypothetical protein